MNRGTQNPQAVRRARAQLPHGRLADELELARRALCEPARMSIIKALQPGELCVTDLAVAIGRPLEATSQHLRILRDLGIVENDRKGVMVYYRLTQDGTARFASVLHDLEETVMKAAQAQS